MADPGHAANKEEFTKIITNNKYVVVDFTATWCGPCKKIAPVFAKQAKEVADVTFIKVDVDEAEDVAAENDINAMPTFVFFVDGKEFNRFSGANGDILVKFIAECKAGQKNEY